MQYNISDIAKLAGVSKATVSRIINNKSQGFAEETRIRVEKIIQELNYRPNDLARSVVRSSSKMVGLIIPDITNPLYPQLVRGVDDYITKNGYNMILCNTDSDAVREQNYLLSLVDKRVDGVIVCSGVSNELFLKEYSQYNTPLVLIGRVFDSHFSDASISGDNAVGAAMATQFLIENGNKHIVYLDGNPNISGSMQKFTGYKETLLANGIAYDEQLVKCGNFSISFGYEAVCALIESGTSFSAIFAGSDTIAIGAVKALKFHKKRIPEDVEIIGCDGIELSEIYEPKLTTIAKPHYEMAKEASRMLIDIIEGNESFMRHLTVRPKLILGDTTKNELHRRGEDVVTV